MADSTAIFLSRLTFNPRSPEVQRCVADCQRLHQTVMRGFPTVDSFAPRKALDVLFRPELDPRTGAFIALVQSGVQPDWSHLEQGGGIDSSAVLCASIVKRIDSVVAQIASGDRLRFRIRANPTKRLPARASEGETPMRADGRAKLGPRVPVIREDEQLAWLDRKAQAAGFQINSAQARPDRFGGRRQTGKKPDIGTITLDAVVFDGELIVREANELRQSLVAGIGSGKAFGFGLLSIGPAQ